MKTLTIGQVAKAAGIAPSAIRYYESAGILARPARKSGRRVYDERILDQLRVVAGARSAGFSVRELKVLMRGVREGKALSKAWESLARDKLVELNETIARARAMKRILLSGLKCRCIDVTDCVMLR